MNIMKRYKNLVRTTMVLLLTVLSSLTAWADDAKITVWLKDGTKTEFLFVDNPNFSYADGNLTIKSDKAEKTWPLSQLNELTFSYKLKKSVTVATEDGQTIPTRVEVLTSNDSDDKSVTLVSASVPDSYGKAGNVAIPADVTINDVTYKITMIGDNTFNGKEDITDIWLPVTDEMISFGTDALMISNDKMAMVHSPLALLDDYSLNENLKQHVDAGKLSAAVKSPSRYWTFSCGVDVAIPDDIKVYTCVIADENTVVINEIRDEKLKVNGKRVIKANNGVLIASADDNVNVYDMVAIPGENAVITVDKDAKSYGENWLEPVIEPKSYAADDYYVLYNNEFRAINNNDEKVPACKAVLRKPAGVNAASSLGITEGNGSTNIDATMSDNDTKNEEKWYNLNGQRVSKPAKKGVYINNGKKKISQGK